MALNLPSRKGVGLVRRLLPDIEAAVREGATLNQVHSALQAEYGLTLNFNSFKNALYRARKDSEGKPESPERVAPTERPNLGGEKAAPPKKEQAAEEPKKKRGIISPKDFRPNPDIEEELEKLASKKYE